MYRLYMLLHFVEVSARRGREGKLPGSVIGDASTKVTALKGQQYSDNFPEKLSF